MKKEIILSTLNARYAHSAFGLRYLLANLGELAAQAEIHEFIISKNPAEIAEELIAKNPKILGFGIYIWNTKQTLQVLQILRSRLPETVIVLGGPEVSYEIEPQEIVKWADYVVAGEGEFLFRDLCTQLMRGVRPSEKIIKGVIPEINKIQTPYHLYSDHDIAHRVIYVEASRGCAFKCEYCLSSLDVKVRSFDLELFLQEMKMLMDRGVRQFKFVDRTFNLSIPTSSRILKFFLENAHLGLFIHFEMVPDRLPTELKDLMSQFPAGALQFEIGVQTWNPQVAALVSRRQDYKKIQENFKFLREHTQVHTHADLIVGLPGETEESFAQGFNALIECDPDEIQVGILKRLKGTPIIRHDEKEQVVWRTEPPFQIHSNRNLNEEKIRQFEVFAKFWDLIANSGNYKAVTEFLKLEGLQRGSVFHVFWQLFQVMHSKIGRTHSIHRKDLTALLHSSLLEVGYSEIQIGKFFLAQRPDNQKTDLGPGKFFSTPHIPQRQQKHLQA